MGRRKGSVFDYAPERRQGIQQQLAIQADTLFYLIQMLQKHLTIYLANWANFLLNYKQENYYSKQKNLAHNI